MTNIELINALDNMRYHRNDEAETTVIDQTILALKNSVQAVRCKDCVWWNENASAFPDYGVCNELLERYNEDCESSFDADTYCDNYCYYGQYK